MQMRGAELPRHNRQNAEASEGMTALRSLLTGIVDYAGLFPPASLDMSTAVSNYRSYETDPSAWMLGRFVVPVARLAELYDAYSELAAQSSPRARGLMRLSALLGDDVATDVEAV